ncbi:MAG: proton-conducting membrane transporter [Planctomycetota bacterium]|nr:MAG: proton-conducting membrane transporter [Planctomycetota bacterium]
MTDRRRLLAIRAAAGIALAWVIVAAVLLAADAWRNARAAPQTAASAATLEEQARRDRSAAESFAKQSVETTAATLRRERWQRVLGVTGLIAAGGFVLATRSLAQHRPAPVVELVSARLTAAPTAQRQADDQVAPSGAALASPPPERPIDLAEVDRIVERIGRDRDHAIALLHAIEQRFHYLPLAALERLAEISDVDVAQLDGVASFYDRFRTTPHGEHVIRVCHGTACHVAASPRITDQLRRELGIAPGADTDPTGLATVEEVACLGCCTLAPVLEVDGRLSGKTAVEDIHQVVQRLRTSPCNHQCQNGHCASQHDVHAAENHDDAGGIEIRIGVGSCCLAGGSGDVIAATEREISRQRLNARVKRVGCVGACSSTPLIEVKCGDQSPLLLARATPDEARALVRRLARSSGAPWKALQRRFERVDDVAELRRSMDEFLAPQLRIVTEHSGCLTPTDLAEYRRYEGFQALQHCLRSLSPETVIETVAQSGLRGRGGAGFPTYAKWRITRNALGADKIVVCNGDEGDPGAYMDRMVMESYPFRVLEGMMIAGYAIGAAEGILYIRREYPLAVERINLALRAMEAAGLLGDRILGTNFSFRARVVEGAGAFVCGEETALIQSIMGERGMPRPRPPYPAESGVHGRPTLVNNVETLANLPWIFRHGAEAFARIGTRDSTGTKVFSLSGKVRRAGLIEAPMGMTLRDVVQRVGGGIPHGKQFKAVQIGGPSGGCVPARLADTPIDYEQLRNVGAIMGSGGLVVLDEDDCMVDLARYFLRFTQRESCGRCTFCRIGTKRLLEILDRICEGNGKRGDLDEIESLAATVSAGSLCGLGKTAPNPVATTLRYFREEYEAHLAGRCPAGRCPALVEYRVTPECIGCTICAQRCPVGAIAATPYEVHVIDSDVCTRCDVCRQVCPEGTIVVGPRNQAAAAPSTPRATQPARGSHSPQASEPPDAVARPNGRPSGTSRAVTSQR